MALGDTVNYKISEQDARLLVQVFPVGETNGVRCGTLPVAGEVIPATVVRDHGANVVNLNLHIDANLGHHVKSATQGSDPGQWSPVA